MSENTINENERATSAEDKNAEDTTATNAAASGQATNETETANAQETAPVTTAIIKIEGQEIPLDAAIAADDNLLKTALSPYYPSIKNAQITRETRNGQVIVSIVKKAEHKGIGGKSMMASKKTDGVSGVNNDVLRRLIKMPETAHQIYELAESLFMLDGDGAERRMTLAEIERVNDYLRQTDQDLKWMQKQLQDLATVEGDFKTNVIPVGF